MRTLPNAAMSRALLPKNKRRQQICLAAASGLISVL
jgi:hypothetical protein